jgi:hypothetical protein
MTLAHICDCFRADGPAFLACPANNCPHCSAISPFGHLILWLYCLDLVSVFRFPGGPSLRRLKEWDGFGVGASFFARMRLEHYFGQEPEPESRKVLPASGMNSQSYELACSVNLRTPKVSSLRSSLVERGMPKGR